jgi:outer membrane protein insertion porin family
LDETVRGDTVDFNMYMLPYKRYRSERKIEGSYNQNNSNNNTFANLLGINISQSVKDRNLAKQAIQTNTSVNASAEFGQKSIVNTIQAGLNYSMVFPKPILLKKSFKNTENPTSFINFNANYSKRIQFFELADIGASFGWQWKKANWNYQLIPINIENKVLDKLDSLKRVIDRNPNLAFIYNDGLIFGPKFNINRSRVLYENKEKNKSTTTSIRYAIETSLPLGKGISKTLNNNLFSFAKFEIDKRYNFIRSKKSWAFRGFLGVGKSYFESLPQNKNLPFFRQFIGGGPNSMRAWTIRSLNSYSTRTSSTEQTDFFGDIQAEANIEFRYKYGKVLGIPILGALFMDFGNIWNFKPIDHTVVPYNLSKSQRLANDIAIAGGTSVRIDFDYFLIRLDLGMKIKEPLDINNKGGFFTRDNFKLSFNNLSPVKLQLGINYPF